MPRSYWKLHLDSTNEESARKVVNRCIKVFDRLPVESSLKKYSKGGYMATLEFFHSDDLSWPKLVMEVIVFGQKLGTGWYLMGHVAHESNAVLSNQQSSSNISVSGVQWAEWQVINENKLNK